MLKRFYFIPKKTNDRIVKQSGAFIMFGLEDLSTNKENDVYKKIIIESGNKRGILDQLSVLEIDRFTLFPELDRRAEVLRKKYGNE